MKIWNEYILISSLAYPDFVVNLSVVFRYRTDQLLTF